LDSIGITLQLEDHIARYENQNPVLAPSS